MMLTDAMRKLVNHQRLGFVAIVYPDGTPNLSPKATIMIWDDEHIMFADIRSPQTMENLRLNPVTGINVVDYLTRKGYRFKGTAEIIEAGPELEEIIAFYAARNIHNPIRAAVKVKIERAEAVISPAYDDPTADEQEIRRRNFAWYMTESGSATPAERT